MKHLLILVAGYIILGACSTESEYVFESDTWTIRHKTQTACTGDDGIESYEDDCKESEVAAPSTGGASESAGYEPLSCTAYRTDTDDGVEILCPNSAPVVLYDGDDGRPGQAGSDGAAGEDGTDGAQGVAGATGGSCHVSCELRLTPRRHTVIRCDDGSEVAWRANCT